MKRVLVIGPCGAGKSTLSKRLGRLLDLPVYHLDQLHWKPGWIEGDVKELRTLLAPILAQERWLIDGNYGSTMELRLAHADTVVYLDFSIPLCLWRAARRVWQYRGKTRPDMTEGCPERFDWQFFQYIAMWNRNVRPRTEALLASADVPIVRLTRPQAVETWLAEQENKQ